mmetsp:Transcript_12226/g.22922  ORF Transcript_12226/g.22922 Transcript_12226/m.22922 type:complete len:297 (+) Transcript_12226:146-1036(+)
MSTAWYKPHFVPKLLKSFPIKNNTASTTTSIEIWNTTCIVTNFGKNKVPKCSILINPSSPSLLGVKKFPYFPRGGPQPRAPPSKFEHHIMGYVSRWGEMDMKEGMLFPSNVVDGIVHELGGIKLAIHCLMLPKKNHAYSLHAEDDDNTTTRCPVGHAVSTPPGGKRLAVEYNRIIHTVPPFYEHYHGKDDPSLVLSNCYRNALRLCDQWSDKNASSSLRIASPLLGAGGRGFPLHEAVTVAAKESLRWRNTVCETDDAKERVLCFGIPQMDIANRLIDALMDLDDHDKDSYVAGNT